MASGSAGWPGFVDEPCADCTCPGDRHMPPCVNIVERKGRREHCGCPAYRSTAAQQPAMFGVAHA